MANPRLGALQDGDAVARELSTRHAGTFATKAALQALPARARFHGQTALVSADRSLWMFDSASVLTTDEASALALEPTVGAGCWLRAESGIVAKLPIAFGLADGATIWTIPEGFAIR